MWEDYFSYLHWLGETLAENECSLHAYVLMTNHVHLLLTPKKAELVPKLIISIGRRYVQYINRTYKRTGTRSDSRYKSSLIHAYRAPFRANLDQEAIDDIRLAANPNQPIGNGRFHAQIEKMVGARREAKPRGRPWMQNDLADPTGASQKDLGL